MARVAPTTQTEMKRISIEVIFPPKKKSSKSSSSLLHFLLFLSLLSSFYYYRLHVSMSPSCSIFTLLPL